MEGRNVPCKDVTMRPMHLSHTIVHLVDTGHSRAASDHVDPTARELSAPVSASTDERGLREGGSATPCPTTAVHISYICLLMLVHVVITRPNIFSLSLALLFECRLLSRGAYVRDSIFPGVICSR